jgi:hypothetical protein
VFEETVNRPSRWRTFWPDVSDVGGAREAIRLATWLSYLGAILSIVGVVFGLANGASFVTLLWSPLFFAVVGFLIARGWRSAAMVGAVLVGLEIIGSVVQGFLPGITAPFIFVGLVNGVRGTFALARLRRRSSEPVVAAGP